MLSTKNKGVIDQSKNINKLEAPLPELSRRSSLRSFFDELQDDTEYGAPMMRMQSIRLLSSGSQSMVSASYVDSGVHSPTRSVQLFESESQPKDERIATNISRNPSWKVTENISNDDDVGDILVFNASRETSV